MDKWSSGYHFQQIVVEMLGRIIELASFFLTRKLAIVLETCGKLPFYFSAFLFCCGDTTAYYFTIRSSVRTAQSNGHSDNFLN